MNSYKHFVSGFFQKKDQTETVVKKLRTLGIPSRRIHINREHKIAPPHSDKDDSNKTLDEMLIDGAVGAAVGTGVGIVAEIALVTANVSLFVASPLLAPLALLGWGASLGGFLGATVGISEHNKPFAYLVQDAINNGQFILIVEATSERENLIAKNIISEAVGEYQKTDNSANTSLSKIS